jgi:hypothetical protein
VALNFPNSPTLGQIYTDATSGFSYEWNGNVWTSYSPSSSSQIQLLDDISASFNGSTQIFALTSSGSPVSPASAKSLIVNLGGVIQDSSDDYTVSGSNISFSTPPATGLTFSGISLGPAIPINTIPNGTSTDGSLTVSGNFSVLGVTTTKDVYVTGIVTATSFVGNVTGNATGLSGTPNLNVGIVTTTQLQVSGKNIGIGTTSAPSDALVDAAGITIYGTTNKTLTYNNTKKGFEFNIPIATNETRIITGAEKVFRTSGNTINLVYNSTSANIGYTTNPTGNITLNVTGIPTSSDFDDHSITFAVIVNNTGTARTCTAVNLNGVPETIRWAGGSLGVAIAGVTTTNGHTIFSFTGINTVGSASTTANYQVFGVASGGFW